MDVSRTDFKPTWLKARSSVLGFLIALTMLGTFIIDIGMPDGIAAWAPYSIAIALALMGGGACHRLRHRSGAGAHADRIMDRSARRFPGRRHESRDRRGDNHRARGNMPVR